MFCGMIAGAVSWIPVYYFPVVRFAASNEWVAAVWPIAVPFLWLLCVIQALLFLSNTAEHNERLKAQWRAKGREVSSRHLLPENALGRFGMMFFLPLFMRVFYLCILVIWAPMLSVAVVRAPTSHDFTVSGLSESSRSPDVIEFEGHYFLVNGVPSPPNAIWYKAEPGDTIRLSGTGNRWGVFYDEIELIKAD